MAKKFLHLGINFEAIELSPSIAAIEAVLNKATDWFRYAPNCWIIYTGRTAKVWHAMLAQIHGMQDQTYFICALDLNDRAGWLQKSAWEWIKNSRDRKTRG